MQQPTMWNVNPNDAAVPSAAAARPAARNSDPVMSDSGSDEGGGAAQASPAAAGAGVPLPLRPLLQQLDGYCATWARLRGVAPPPLPVDDLDLYESKSFVEGPHVLWWGPPKQIDTSKQTLSLGSRSMLGLQVSTGVKVTVWQLAPTVCHVSRTQPPPPQAPSSPAAAEAAGGPDAWTCVQAAPLASFQPVIREHQRSMTGPQAAAVAHDWVPGSWKQLDSFDGKLYVGNSLGLGPSRVLAASPNLHGQRLLRAELVRLEHDVIDHETPRMVCITLWCYSCTLVCSCAWLVHSTHLV